MATQTRVFWVCFFFLIREFLIIYQINLLDKDSESANDFLAENNRAKRFLYTAREQRREAKEKYEEKCERKFLGISTHKPRWCPPLEQ